MRFDEWITRKYLDWRGDGIGNGVSITEFAKQFGASHQIMLEWMKKEGRVPRSQKYITALHKIYGKEVLDILGLEEPDTIIYGLDRWPPEVRDRFLAAVEEVNRTLVERGLIGSSPEAPQVIRLIFEKYGFNPTVNDNPKPQIEAGTEK